MRARRIAWLFCFVTVLLSQSAQAQGVPIYEATKKQLADAQETFREGSKLYYAGKYEEAMAALRKSQATVASPNTSLMIARCLLGLGQVRESHAQYRAALEEAQIAAEHNKKYASTVDAVREEIAEMEGKVGRVKVHLLYAPPDTNVFIGDVALTGEQIDEPMLVAPGKVTVRAVAPDGKEVKQTVSVQPGKVTDIDLTFQAKQENLDQPPANEQPPPDTETKVKVDTSEGMPPLRTAAFIAGGVGVLGVAAFAVFGSMSNSKFDDLERACPDNNCPPGVQGDIDDGERFQLFANIGLGAGIVGLGTGVTLFLLSGDSAPEGEKASRAPSIAVGPASVTVRGRF